MTKFILLVIFIFFVVRAVVRLVRRGLFFFRSGGEHIRPESSRQIEESDYEVIESRLHDKENDGT